MKVVTCISDIGNIGYRSLLKTSCAAYDLELVTLTHHGPWTSHRQKDVHFREYLAQVDPQEIVLFTDGYDATMLAPEDTILRKYAAFNSSIVFSAEKNCWPDRRLANAFPPTDTPFRYPNSGGFIGTVQAILTLLDYYCDAPPSGERFTDPALADVPAADLPLERSNQYVWTLICLTHPDIISLDTRAELFLELGTAQQELTRFQSVERHLGLASPVYRREIHRLRTECMLDDAGEFNYRPTNTKPCHVHFNGPLPKAVVLQGYLNDRLPWRGRREAGRPISDRLGG